jgi:predicted aconitase
MNPPRELDILRVTLGRLGSDMLLFIASQEGSGLVVQITPRIAHVSAERIKKARLKLETLGLIRTERHPHYGYGYEIIRPEDLPMLAPALKQWHEERKELRAAHAAKQGVAA